MRFLFFTFMFLLLVSTSWAESITINTAKDKTINIYGVNSEATKDAGSSNGVGLMFDSEKLKFKAEGTPDFYNLGTVVKFNPFKQFYLKTGASFVDQKVSASNASERVQQYSGALATGYQLKEDLYFELGGSYTKLNGKNIGNNFFIDDETTKRAYFEGVKRWKTKNLIIDTSANVGTIIPENSSNSTTYGTSVDLYPTFLEGSKIGYTFQHEDNNVLHGIEVQYGYLAASYKRNVSQDTYQATLGLKIAFDNVLDPTSYRKPSKIIPHLSELHAFENIVLNSNMRLQSSKGVQEKKEGKKDTTPEIIDGPTGDDKTPDQFRFIDKTDFVQIVGQTTQFMISNAITVSGLSDGVRVSIGIVGNAGAAYNINGGAFTSTSGTVENGDIVKIGVQSRGGLEVAVTLTIGDKFDQWVARVNT